MSDIYGPSSALNTSRQKRKKSSLSEISGVHEQ